MNWSFNFSGTLYFYSCSFYWSCRCLTLNLLCLCYWRLNCLTCLIISISGSILLSSCISSNWTKCKCVNPASTNICTLNTIVISDVLSNIYVLTSSCSTNLSTNASVNWGTHNWCGLCDCTIFVNNLGNGIVLIKSISCNNTIKCLSIVGRSCILAL